MIDDGLFIEVLISKYIHDFTISLLLYPNYGPNEYNKILPSSIVLCTSESMAQIRTVKHVALVTLL